MPGLTITEKSECKTVVPSELLKGKRQLTEKEIELLEKNRNSSQEKDWSNVYVSDEENCFDADLIRDSRFEGFVVLGKIQNGSLKFHDLELSVGIVNSLIRDCVIGDYCAVRNVSYLANYRLAERVILFNVQEMSCTNHSRFGNGFVFEGEEESHRYWIGVANENEGRAVLPFEGMIAADAYIWSQNREDELLQKKFIQLTDEGFSKKTNTFGIVENDVVIKNVSIIKDTKICAYAYIKGAFKIKNVTILSNDEEVTQIGEGVELVNGIVGYGSRIFYQAVAVRFVIGRNCQLKYGARLLNSVLGDNSTVSCCELLNNLIFPFHEQHHNSSFLIATTVMGQSNIAAGATIGSNHNSRSPDGEIVAGRGFWPGLCTNFKHNSKFASFVLAAKGNYSYELNITYPFSLVSPGDKSCEPVHILPGWWFMYDMFAIVRNQYKFKARDKRFEKVQNIEMSPLAPDTMQEVLSALDRIVSLTANNLASLDANLAIQAQTQEQLYQLAKDYLHQHPDAKFTLTDMMCQKKFGATIYKPVQGYKTYRKILKYYATKTILDYCHENGESFLSKKLLNKIYDMPLYTKWQNLGGQVIPADKVRELFELIKTDKIQNWTQVHEYYNKCQCEYAADKVRYAIYIMEWLYSRSLENFTPEIFKDILKDVTVVSNDMYESSVSSREKDYTDYFRCMTYSSKEEMAAVIGSLNDNSFLKQLKDDTKEFNAGIKDLFKEFV